MNISAAFWMAIASGSPSLYMDQYTTLPESCLPVAEPPVEAEPLAEPAAGAEEEAAPEHPANTASAIVSARQSANIFFICVFLLKDPLEKAASPFLFCTFSITRTPRNVFVFFGACFTVFRHHQKIL